MGLRGLRLGISDWNGVFCMVLWAVMVGCGGIITCGCGLDWWASCGSGLLVLGKELYKFWMGTSRSGNVE